MDSLTLVPSTGQFFLVPASAEGPRSLAAARLHTAGWPATAQLVRGGRAEGAAQGSLIELLDALPVLAAIPPGDLPPDVASWARAARLGLGLVLRGRILPRLRARRVRGDDERVAGWEARWTVALGPGERAEAEAIARELGAAAVAVPVSRPGKAALPGKGSRPLPLPADAVGKGYSAAGLVRRFLDLCADTLVREASRRGAFVRLGGWPADAWEQRLVRALIDDRAGFAARPPDPAPAVLCRELKRWTDELAFSAALLPSPDSWQAPEPLARAMERMGAPARMLAERLFRGEPAPRTLAPAALAAGPQMRARLNQAIAVTRTLIQRTQQAEGEKTGSGR